MSLDSKDERTLRRYLLGELSDEEQSREEERFLTDKDYFERLLLVEDDLMDEYVSGALSQVDREKVGRRFLLSPKRQERVSLAGNLQRYARGSPALPGHEQDQDEDFIPILSWHRKRVYALLILCSSLVVIIAAAILFREMASLKNRIETLNREQQSAERRAGELSQGLAEQLNRSESLQQKFEQEQNRRIQLDQELSDLKQSLSAASRTDSSRFISLSLIPVRLRDGGQPSIVDIPRSIQVLRLELSLESDAHTKYRAIVQTVEGVRIFSRSALRLRRSKDDRQVELPIPASLLGPDDYIVLLSPAATSERTGTYYFTVVRKK